MDRGPSFVSGSLQGIAVFLNAVVQAAPAAIDRHVRMMTQHEDDPAVARNLQCVLDSLDLVKTIIREKAAQCMHDDRGHSKLFVRKDGDPIIAVSCWNCTLQELRTHFEAEIGPYAGMLERYAQQTIQAGASCYIHIFYCFTTEKVGTTVCYLDVVERKCIKPNELM
jgi:hypothetical protein